MTPEIIQKAKELLAAEWAADGRDDMAMLLIKPELGTVANPAIRAIAKALQDTQRMDWFSGGISRWLSKCPTGEWCAQDDVVGHWYADTPRAAIDAAIADDQADESI